MHYLPQKVIFCKLCVQSNQRPGPSPEHLKKNKRDHHTRRGLIAMVSRRRKLMTYLKRKNPESLTKLAKELKLKVKD